MSKLAQARKALGENSNITIVAVKEENCLLNGGGSCGYSVDFYVVSKKGVVYDANELQKSMPELELKLISVDLKDSYVFQFCEDIGTEFFWRKIVLADKNGDDGFTNGEKIIRGKKKIQRTVRIRLFPNEKIATATFNLT